MAIPPPKNFLLRSPVEHATEPAIRRDERPPSKKNNDPNQPSFIDQEMFQEEGKQTSKASPIKIDAQEEGKHEINC